MCVAQQEERENTDEGEGHLLSDTHGRKPESEWRQPEPSAGDRHHLSGRVSDRGLHFSLMYTNKAQSC